MLTSTQIVGMMPFMCMVAMPQAGESQETQRAHPLVVAHRGFSSEYPENTAASMKAAVALGADFVEIDVWRSKDGVPVVIHDDDLERTTGTQGKIYDLSLEEIKKLDAGLWKDPQFAGEKIPTLDEILQITQGRSILVIEVKQTGIEKEILDVLRARQALHDVLLFSFYPGVIETFTALEPKLPSIWLLDEIPEDPAAQRDILDTAGALGASGVGVSLLDLKDPFARVCHLAGFSLAVWTVDIPAMQQRMIDLGVDYIITNRPDILLKTLSGTDNK